MTTKYELYTSAFLSNDTEKTEKLRSLLMLNNDTIELCKTIDEFLWKFWNARPCLGTQNFAQFHTCALKLKMRFTANVFGKHQFERMECFGVAKQKLIHALIVDGCIKTFKWTIVKRRYDCLQN